MGTVGCYGAAAKLAETGLFRYPARLNFQPTVPFRDGLTFAIHDGFYLIGI